MTLATILSVPASTASVSDSSQPRAAGSTDHPVSFAFALDETLQSLAGAANGTSCEATGSDEPVHEPDTRTPQEPLADTLALLLASTQLPAIRPDAPNDPAAPDNETAAVRLASARDDIRSTFGARSVEPDAARSGFHSSPDETRADSPPQDRDLAASAAPLSVLATGRPSHPPSGTTGGDAGVLSRAALAWPPRTPSDSADGGQTPAAPAGGTPARTLPPPALAAGAGKVGRMPMAPAVAENLERKSTEGWTGTTTAMELDGSDPATPLTIEVTAPTAAAVTSMAIAPAHFSPTPSSPASVSNLASMVGSAEWAQELAQKVLQFGPGREIELNLNPAELGPLRIRLSVGDNQAQILFTSEHQAVRHALETALPQLRAAFADNGISLGQTTVGPDTGERRFQGGAGDDQRQRGDGRPEQSSELRQPAASGMTEVLADSHHAVDTFV